MSKYLKLTAVFILLSITGVQAQLKLGHINSTELLSFMPETKNADSTLQKFGSSLENQLKTMSAEYDGKVSDFKSKESSLSEPIREAKIKEITDLETRIQDFQQSAQSSIQKKKEELYSPIIKKAEDAIHAVAKDKGYTYVFDSSVGVLLWAEDSEDMMTVVKQKLGLK
jgi:outer membrane protein